MAIGPGKYDDELTKVRQATHAEGALLLVINGQKGSGFSAQLSIELTLTLPTILRDIARQLEDGGPAAS